MGQNVRYYEENMSKMSRMRMLRWIRGNTIVSASTISSCSMENRLRWFGHLIWRPRSVPIRRSDETMVKEAIRTRNRPNQTWTKTIKMDVLVIDLMR